MSINDFLQIDPSFNSSMFLSKVNNIFVKLLTSVMLDNIISIDHFVSDEVYGHYKTIIDQLREKKQRQMYDELNVKQSYIQSIDKVDDRYVISVYLEARYMDYVIDLNTHSVISGNNQSRIQKNYKLIFVRKDMVKEIGVVRRCPGCGASLNINDSGRCPYCHRIYNQEDYDFILDKIVEL